MSAEVEESRVLFITS